MNSDRSDYWVAAVLIAYLCAVGLTAAMIIAINFPQELDGKVQFVEEQGRIVFAPFLSVRSPEQGLVLLAFLAGVTGSFLHAAQSLTSYVGNGQFRASWTAWYVMRPWIGGILGFSLYFVFRAGLVAGASGVDPFGAVALGVLGGWFSKTTSDKLQEVFETLFKTDADQQRRDKLKQSDRPTIDTVEPNPVAADVTSLTVRGRHFAQDAQVTIGDQALAAEVVSDAELTVNLTLLSQRPSGEVAVAVKNPAGSQRASEAVTVRFIA